MPSPSLLLHAHPASAWWVAASALVVVALLLARRRPDGRAVAAFGLGLLAVVSLAPPRNGLVRGLARTCDLRPEHLLLPTEWVRQDPRTGAVVVMLVVGAAVSTRGRWVAGAASVPVLVELVQYAVPSLGRACSVPDVVPAWTALAVGVGAGLSARAADRWLRGLVSRALAATVLGAVVVTSLGAWSLRTGPGVDPHARVALLGEGFVPAEPSRGAGGAAPGAWQDAGDVPGGGTSYEEMGRAAVRDLMILTTSEDGQVTLPPAGPAESWDYFWPRDGAFVAVALARVGEAERAAAVLGRVGGLYLDPMYGFDARYLLDGGRVALDPRRAQGDGCGWVLWAIHETVQSTTPGPLVDDLRDRCTDQLLRATGGGSHLPAPGQDYWERTTFDHLLGVSGPVALGLRVAARDYEDLGRPGRAAVVGGAAEGVRSRIEAHFGPGYLRAGTHGGLDAAAAMLMPPFDPDPLPGVERAWEGYQRDATRPGGGLAPGTEWKQDGVSWTPEVALVAYTAAASGREETAHRWLGWLDQHLAPWGSLPEKVDSAGAAAGPAPLGWTSALVILTLDELATRPAVPDDREAPS